MDKPVRRGRPKLSLLDVFSTKISIEGMDRQQVRAMLEGPPGEWVKDKHWVWTGACFYSPDKPRFQHSHGSIKCPKTAAPMIGRNGTSIPARVALGDLLFGAGSMTHKRVIVQCAEPRCMNPEHWVHKPKLGTPAGGIDAIIAEIKALDPAPDCMSNLLERVKCYAPDEVRLAAKMMGLFFA